MDPTTLTTTTFTLKQGSTSISGTVGYTNQTTTFTPASQLDYATTYTAKISTGTQAKNIFWQTASAVFIGSGSHFEGIILAKTQISLNTGATINGRLLSQTAIALISNTVTEPAN